jgi:hypothetical protein
MVSVGVCGRGSGILFKWDWGGERRVPDRLLCGLLMWVNLHKSIVNFLLFGGRGICGCSVQSVFGWILSNELNIEL